MAIVQTIDTSYELEQEFKAYGRGYNFSYKGLRKLFEYLENYSDDAGVDFVLDVVALCCDYCECESIEEFMQEYGQHTNVESFDFDAASEEEQLQMIRKYLEDNTSVVCCEDDCILFQVF